VAAARVDEDWSGVSVVGMDETSVAKGHQYITLFVDIEQRKTLHIAEGKDAATVKAFAAELHAHGGKPDKITDVSCDMSSAFIKGVAENLPNAQVTFDKFHILKIINEAVDAVRREEAKTNPLLKGARYCLIALALHKSIRQSLCFIVSYPAMLLHSYGWDTICVPQK
jgi:transposase